MDTLTREETLKVLSELGIDLPPASKLPGDALEKRLRQALNAAQYVPRILPDPPSNPAALHPWPENGSMGGSRSVHEAVKRNNVAEINTVFEARKRGQNNPYPLYESAIMDVRQTLMSIGKYWDEGVRWCVIQDPECEISAINVKLLSVHELNAKTPVIAVLYQNFAEGDNPLLGIQWCQAQVDKYGPPAYCITATILEQKILLKLQDFEDDYKVSFPLPVGPLGYEDIAKLNSDTGCALCGKKSSSRCSQCQTVSYCGQDCQRADWPHHKRTCRSLRGGVWRTVPFANVVPGPMGKYSVLVNHYTPLTDLNDIKSPNPDEPQLNIHGDKLFLVKLQNQQSSGPMASETILIYDRRQSLVAYFVKGKASEVYDEIRKEIQGPRGGYQGLKTYRWAKRVGDWELSICLDREPQTEIRW
ncbi:uncharacterized protein LAESUDRAFT_760660 [Laetiporus sulphureus 93-53]|uniref:MYND-type domain-containing protein n=1 Tax=Laetiporus sulphureus 93-53 TaxID=1314785 RepID=A0A165DHU8_9APHY|nr:uncharacterized protein LAESUDRAFT_760660 [Laetiporus sulphureus 93-53]KZT04914.1 hypothetical protein LAESUDRAFT_760660 [Laetiporus sulphureus 93-53]